MSDLSKDANTAENDQPTPERSSNEPGDALPTSLEQLEIQDDQPSIAHNASTRRWGNSRLPHGGGAESSSSRLKELFETPARWPDRETRKLHPDSFDSLTFKRERVGGKSDWQQNTTPKKSENERITRQNWRSNKVETNEEDTTPKPNSEPITDRSSSTPTSPETNPFELVTSASKYSRRRKYQLSKGPYTINGLPWSSFRRGSIIRAQDFGRRYVGRDKKAGDEDVVEVNGVLRLDKPRYWIVMDRFAKHLEARPIYTHSHRGLKGQDRDVKEQSMCIAPIDEEMQAGWKNEAAPNEVIHVQEAYGHWKLPATASVRVTQAFTLDYEEEFELAGRIEEGEVRKMEELEHALRLASREGDKEA